MGSHGNALAVSFLRRRARLHLRAHDFLCITEKKYGKLGCHVSFNEIHVVYTSVIFVHPVSIKYVCIKNFVVIFFMRFISFVQ